MSSILSTYDAATRAKDDGPPPLPEPMAPTPPNAARPASLYAFFAKHGISADTVDLFGLYVETHSFLVRAAVLPSIVFPYTGPGGTVLRRRYRPADGGAADDVGAPVLYNAEAIASDDVVWWCDDELAAMAMHEAGYPQTVAMPVGLAPLREGDDRLLPLQTHADLLLRVKKFVLAGDGDKVGEVLREELATRLGRHRCWLVTWPEGCTSAADVLRDKGAEAVRAAVEAAEPWPIEGVQRLTGSTLLELRNAPPVPILTTGISSLDRAIHIPGDGRIIVMLGIPGMGKTAFLRWIMMHTAEHESRKWLVWSPEMRPWARFAASCAATRTGKMFAHWPGQRVMRELMTDAELLAAERWMMSRFLFLNHDGGDRPPSLDWLLEQATACALRMGVTDVLIDPWNELDNARNGATHEDYLARCLQRILAFCNRYQANVWIAVHPIKLFPPKPGGEIPAPGLYDISGGAMWGNKLDVGLTIHTPAGVSGEAEIYLRKVKDAAWGIRNTIVRIGHDPMTGRYWTLGADLLDEPPPGEVPY